MMTFSTSSGTYASLPFNASGVTLLCIVPVSGQALRLCDSGRAVPRVRLPLFPPPRDGTPELEERDRPRDRRQPERELALGQHREAREAVVDAEPDQRADHAAVHAADAARQRQQVAEHADEEP